jgi:hypothetical protein
VLAKFPGAEIVNVRQGAGDTAAQEALPPAETGEDMIDEAAYGLDGRPDAGFDDR